MNRKIVFGLSVVALVAIAAAGWFGYSRRGGAPAATPPRQSAPGQVAPAEVSLTPVKADGAGIDVTTPFRLTAVNALSADALRSRLTVKPAVALKIEKADPLGKEFTISPAATLEAGRIYQFRLADLPGLSRAYQWSFQTKSTFRIISTLPRDQATGVPVNTGIEINFSHSDYADVDGLFSITPAAAGRFERHGKSVAFVPQQPLQPGTVYTVTLKAGLGQTTADGKLTQEHVFAFETKSEESPKATWFYVPPDVQEFPTADAPYFQVGYTGSSPGSVQVTAWRYPDATRFMSALAKADQMPWWAAYTRGRYREQVTGLTQVASFTAELKTVRNTAIFLFFPEKLPPGYYLAEFGREGQVRQVRFQVTDLASFVSVTSTKTLVWLHDLSTRAPVSGAAVGYPGEQPLTTDRDGVATVPTPVDLTKPGSHAQAFLLARATRAAAATAAAAPAAGAAMEAVIHAAPASVWPQDNPIAHYWRYLYIDRSLFRPDDVLNLWGIVRPRDGSVAPAERVTVQATRWDYSGGIGQTVTLAKTELPVQESVFTGSLPLVGFRPGNYSLEARLGDEVLSSTWFEVKTYTKPAYTVTLTPERKALFAMDTMKLQVNAAFFEGTPVPNLRLQCSGCTGSAPDVVTDGLGQSTVQYSPLSDAGQASWGGGAPQTAWINLHAAGAEAGEITAAATVAVFPNSTYLDVTSAVHGTEAELTATMRQIVLERVNAGASPYDRSAWLGAPAPGLPVSGTVTEQNWIREDDGEDYDFINKRVVKRYRYRPDPKVVATFSAVTDAQGQVHYRFPVSPDKPYQVSLSAQDTNGRGLGRQIPVAGTEYRTPDTYRYWYLNTTKSQWQIAEDARFTMTENGKPIGEKAGAFLFFTARFGLQSYTVQGSPAFTTRLKAADLPNASVAGVYFDGREYRYTAPRWLTVDRQERALQVTVATDKPAYRPGESVTLTINAADKNGGPAAGTKVNLNLVDEALYALRDQNVDLLRSLYADTLVPSGILRTNSSHKVPVAGPVAEKGGEGGGGRSDFRDTVLFRTVTTDSNGKASVTFQVPDNLTSWRLTYQAVNPATMAVASGTQPVVVKLPFFIDLVLGDSYLTGDKPVLQMRSFGTSLKEGEPVTYAAALMEPQGNTQEWRRAGTAFTQSALPLPALKAGAYKVTVKAAGPDGLTDSVTLGFTVADSYLTREQVDFYQVKAGTKVAADSKSVATLTFTDYSRSRYLRLLWQLRYAWGNRLEQKLGRAEATALLKRYFEPEGAGDEAGIDLMAYQTPAGSLAILPYADGDLKLSALAADLAPGRFDRTALAGYFQKVLDAPDSDREQVALALYGLAAVDEPALPAVLQLLKAGDLTLTERFFLAMAAARYGDLETARSVFGAILQESGEQIGDTIRIRAGSSTDEMLEATALAAALSSRLGEPSAVGLVGYLTEKQPTEVLLTLEEALAATNGLAGQADAPAAAVTFTVDGKEQRQELKPGSSFSLALMPASLATLQVTDVTGNVGLTVRYPAKLSAAEISPTPGFQVSLSSDQGAGGAAGGPAGSPGGGYRVGDLVKFTLAYSMPETAPGGGYEITTDLPAGLRLVQNPWIWGAKTNGRFLGWPLEIDGGRITFAASYRETPIDFYARVVTPGEYTAEQTTLQHERSGKIYALGERWTARIGE